MHWTLHYLRGITGTTTIASGDLDKDIWALRHFVSKRNHEVVVIRSFPKYKGLCGERFRAFHLLTAPSDATARAKGHSTGL